eukprot:scaffold116089_cov63-Phaeocystis_antarctica.AAC.1
MQSADIEQTAGSKLACDRVEEGRPIAAIVEQYLVAWLLRLQCRVQRLERRAHRVPSLQKSAGVSRNLSELVAGDITPGAVRVDDGVRRSRSRHDARVSGQRQRVRQRDGFHRRHGEMPKHSLIAKLQV